MRGWEVSLARLLPGDPAATGALPPARGGTRDTVQPPALTLTSPAHSTPHTHPTPTRPPCLPSLSHLPGGEPSENPQTQTKSPVTLPLPQMAIVKSFGVCSCQPVTHEYFTGGFCF